MFSQFHLSPCQMLLFVSDLSLSLDKGKQMVINVLTANTAFLSGLSQVTTKLPGGVKRGGESGAEEGEGRQNKLQLFL